MVARSAGGVSRGAGDDRLAPFLNLADHLKIPLQYTWSYSTCTDRATDRYRHPPVPSPQSQNTGPPTHPRDTRRRTHTRDTRHNHKQQQARTAPADPRIPGPNSLTHRRERTPRAFTAAGHRGACGGRSVRRRADGCVHLRRGRPRPRRSIPRTNPRTRHNLRGRRVRASAAILTSCSLTQPYAIGLSMGSHSYVYIYILPIHTYRVLLEAYFPYVCDLGRFGLTVRFRQLQSIAIKRNRDETHPPYRGQPSASTAFDPSCRAARVSAHAIPITAITA